MLEDAQRRAVGLDRLPGLDAALAERDQLAGLDLAQQLGADDVERAALGGDHVAVLELPRQSGRTPAGSRKATTPVVGHDDRRVGARSRCMTSATASSIRSAGSEEISAAMISESEVDRNLTPCSRQLVVELDRVDQVAVVGEGDRAAVVPVDGLGVLPAAAAGGRVAHVPDRHVAGERPQAALVEDLGDQAEVALGGDVAALAGRDAGRFLAAVLEREEREVGEPGDVVLGRVDAEDAALVARAVRGSGEFGRNGRARCAPRAAASL